MVAYCSIALGFLGNPCTGCRPVLPVSPFFCPDGDPVQ